MSAGQQLYRIREREAACYNKGKQGLHSVNKPPLARLQSRIWQSFSMWLPILRLSVPRDVRWRQFGQDHKRKHEGWKIQVMKCHWVFYCHLNHSSFSSLGTSRHSNRGSQYQEGSNRNRANVLLFPNWPEWQQSTFKMVVLLFWLFLGGPVQKSHQHWSPGAVFPSWFWFQGERVKKQHENKPSNWLSHLLWNQTALNSGRKKW